MMRALFRLWPALFALAVTALAADSVAPGPRPRPNIVVILADDLGYGDLSSYNPARGKIATPHLDRFAREGLRFTDAHSSSGVCSPSRYTLLTGRYHWRTRLQAGIVNLWDAPLIAPGRMTISRLAQQQGYHTAAIGKWHLGWDWPFSSEEKATVVGLGGRAGFGKGTLVTASTDAQRTAWRAMFARPIAGGPTTRGFDHYFGTDVPNWPPYCFIRDDRTVGVPTELLKAEQFAGFQASLQGPALPDWRLDAIVGGLAERAVAYVEERARAGIPFLLYLPLTTPHTPIAPSAAWRGRSGLNDYADLVMETDAVVGRVLAALESAGVARNTLVVFTSDNGYEAAIGTAPLESKGHFPSGPLRGYKRDAWEGGHRVPFIVRWPGIVVPATVSDELVHHADLLATLAELWGTRLPADAGEDSYSLLPVLHGGRGPVREHAVSCSANGVQTLREGPWKLICTAKPQLYHVGRDVAERENLAAQHPERVQAMLAVRERLIAQGRSTPGPPQPNDVPVKRTPN